MNIFERSRAIKRNSTQDKIRKAGDDMANHILEQLHDGQCSPFEIEVTKSTKHLSDEMFLLRSTKRAVERLASEYEGGELPLYDEAATMRENHENNRRELTVIFRRPSEA